MKNYTYTGTSNLTFSFNDKDYLIHGHGPHDLPEDAPVVKSNITRGKLVLTPDQTKVKKSNPEK